VSGGAGDSVQTYSSEETLNTASCTRITSLPGCAAGSLWACSDSSSGQRSYLTSSNSYWADNLPRTTGETYWRIELDCLLGISIDVLLVLIVIAGEIGVKRCWVFAGG